MVLSSLTDKNREKLIGAGAEEYVEKSSLTSPNGDNVLPKLLEDIICRINRKRGTFLSRHSVYYLAAPIAQRKG